MKDALLEGTYESTILAGASPDAASAVENAERVVPEKTQPSYERGVVRLLPLWSTTVRISKPYAPAGK